MYLSRKYLGNKYTKSTNTVGYQVVSVTSAFDAEGVGSGPPPLTSNYSTIICLKSYEKTSYLVLILCMHGKISLHRRN
jgi:hypothetical protein